MKVFGKGKVQRFYLDDDGTFPNNDLPVMFYKNALDLPVFFKGKHVRALFEKNAWTNSWKDGIYTYHHYHSTTHEVLGFIKGKTTVQLGGKNGIKLKVAEGDVLIIPAGVAHRNLKRKNDVVCIGAYPNGRDYDMNKGLPDERPAADHRIALVPIPANDPVKGAGKGVCKWWKP